ncbi:hypothetical protein S245_031203, partial [Arachis hypogaea]
KRSRNQSARPSLFPSPVSAACPRAVAPSVVFQRLYVVPLQSTISKTISSPPWRRRYRNQQQKGMHVITVEGMGSCKRVFISIAGLVLFSFLIGNMQTYLQSTTTTLEEMRVKRRDAEYQMSHRLLPDSLRQQIRQYEQYKWQETRGVDEDNLICNLPKDLRRDIKRHLCLALLMRVCCQCI